MSVRSYNWVFTAWCPSSLSCLAQAVNLHLWRSQSIKYWLTIRAILPSTYSLSRLLHGASSGLAVLTATTVRSCQSSKGPQWLMRWNMWTATDKRSKTENIQQLNKLFLFLLKKKNLAISLHCILFLYAHDKESVLECLQNVKSFINQSIM